MKLEHICAYLPYGLKFLMPKHQFKYGEQIILPLNGISISSEGEIIMEFLKPDDGLLFSNECERKCLPIFRPLSDLTKSITHNGETFVPMLKLSETTNSGSNWNYYVLNYNNIHLLNYEIIKHLFEWHFDVFGLIKSGEAIDINTLPKH